MFLHCSLNHARGVAASIRRLLLASLTGSTTTGAGRARANTTPSRTCGDVPVCHRTRVIFAAFSHATVSIARIISARASRELEMEQLPSHQVIGTRVGHLPTHDMVDLWVAVTSGIVKYGFAIEYRDLEPPRTGIFDGLRIVIDPDVGFEMQCFPAAPPLRALGAMGRAVDRTQVGRAAAHRRSQRDSCRCCTTTSSRRQGLACSCCTSVA